MHRALVADRDRNTQIITDVTEALSRGRNCLILARRVAHVAALRTMLAGRGHDALVLQSGMSAADRRAATDRLADTKTGDGVLVVGTTPFIGEGFDAPALDTLFMAAPRRQDGRTCNHSPSDRWRCRPLWTGWQPPDAERPKPAILRCSAPVKSKRR